MYCSAPSATMSTRFFRSTAVSGSRIILLRAMVARSSSDGVPVREPGGVVSSALSWRAAFPPDAPAAPAEPVAVVGECRVEDGLQHLQHRLLDKSVESGGHA